MGWTSQKAKFYKMRGRKKVVDCKAECDAMFDEGYEVIKSAMVGAVYYAAIRKKDSSDVWAAIFRTRTDMNDAYNFAYKDMDETMLPFYFDCPASILKLLSPTDNPSALEWRERCWTRLNHKKRLSSLPVGTTIQFTINETNYEFTKHAPAFQFKTPFWYNQEKNAYMSKTRIPIDFKIVEAGD